MASPSSYTARPSDAIWTFSIVERRHRRCQCLSMRHIGCVPEATFQQDSHAGGPCRDLSIELHLRITLVPRLPECVYTMDVVRPPASLRVCLPCAPARCSSEPSNPDFIPWSQSMRLLRSPRDTAYSLKHLLSINSRLCQSSRVYIRMCKAMVNCPNMRLLPQ